MTEIQQIHCNKTTIFAGCNIVSHCATWGRNNLVAYGAGRAVALYSPAKKEIVGALRGHKSRVNAVVWLDNISEDSTNRWQAPEVELVSGSSDSNVIVWKQSAAKNWEASQTLAGHKDSVTSIAAHSLKDGTTFIVSTSADCSVNIWKRVNQQENFSLEQTLTFTPRMMECVSISHIVHNDTEVPLLAIAGVDTLIHLYIYSQGQFHKLLGLQGHEDWIRCVSFAISGNDVMLASSSQDAKVRLWRITNGDSTESSSSTTANLLASLTVNQGNRTTTISSKGHIFRLGDSKYTVLLESVLSGHEDWVNSVVWKQPIMKEGKLVQEMCILSASMDKSMIVWRPSEKLSGIWIDEVRVGELGGNTLGFYGGVFSPDGKHILAHGYNGAFHLWMNTSTTSDQETWEPQVTVSGHYGPVMDLTWDPSQEYLVSVSEDQTSRCFAEWRRTTNDDINKEEKVVTWHEISRPLLHGHDLSCLCFVNGVNHRMVTGAEEKVIRVFDAPQTFVNTLQNICQLEQQVGDENRPLGANIPPLGLSNKPVFQGANQQAAEAIAAEEYGDFDGTPPPAPTTHSSPPFEDHLLQSTLWPEVHKLYGHPNELVAVTSNYAGTLVASSCKGTQAEESAIRIWNTSSWKEVAKLIAHKLTAVQLEFSHNDRYLVSASRDRQFCVFQIDPEFSITLVAKVKAHERIVWTCSWSNDDSFIATGSRDKTLKIWEKEPQTEDKKEQTWNCVCPVTFAKPVTAVAWLPNRCKQTFSNMIAVGLDDGLISLLLQSQTEKVWSVIYQIPTALCHAETVRRLRWRNKENNEAQLASCSTDNSIRIYHLKF